MDGKRTPVYDLVKQTNGEIRALSRVFLNASVVKVSHAGRAMEPQTTAFTPEAPIQSLDVADGNFEKTAPIVQLRPLISLLNPVTS